MTKQIKPKVSKTPGTKNELKSLFVLSSHGNKSQKQKLFDCLTLYENLFEKNQTGVDIELCEIEFTKDQSNLCLFGNRATVCDILHEEQAELKRLNFEKWWILEIWKGNITKIVKEFRESNSLNDTLYCLYQTSTGFNENSIELLNIYIEQLSKETSTFHDSVHKAVMYSLASYQVDKAIEIYLSNNLYQYALCLAQLRLSPKSSLFQKVLSKYAAYSTHVGDYETAIMCYIRDRDFENAYKVLLRRNSKNDLEFENMIKILSDKLSGHLNAETKETQP